METATGNYMFPCLPSCLLRMKYPDAMLAGDLLTINVEYWLPEGRETDLARRRPGGKATQKLIQGDRGRRQGRLNGTGEMGASGHRKNTISSWTGTFACLVIPYYERNRRRGWNRSWWSRHVRGMKKCEEITAGRNEGRQFKSISEAFSTNKRNFWQHNRNGE